MERRRIGRRASAASCATSWSPPCSACRRLAGRELTPARPSRAASPTATSWSPRAGRGGSLRHPAGRERHAPARHQPRGRACGHRGRGRGGDRPRGRPPSSGRRATWSPASSSAARSARSRSTSPPCCARVADSLRRIHGGPAIPGSSCRCGSWRRYRALAADRGVPIPPAYERARDARPAHRAGAAGAARSSSRPCHNDLLNANFIDDGERLRIVDWEYAGHGRSVLRPRQLQHQPRAAAERPMRPCCAPTRASVRPARLARLSLMRVVSDFREAMWGVLQQGISSLDFDFVAYADEHFERLLATRPTPAFERAPAGCGGWLSAAACPIGRGCVIIGGGVGGAAVAYHLTRLGCQDVAAAGSVRADQRLHLPLGRPGGPAARQPDPDPDDGRQRRHLPRPGGRDRASTPAGARSARCGWPPRRSGWRSCAGRRAGPRRTGWPWSSSVHPRRRTDSR